MLNEGVEELSHVIVNRSGLKGDLVANFVRAVQLVERQHNRIINQTVHVGSYQSDITKLQEQVFTLQDRLLQAKGVSDNFKTDIVNSVHKQVKSVEKSFSDVVKSCSINNSTASISIDSLISVARQMVVEEDLSRNVMVFGSCEDDNEEICTRVAEVFESLGEKPRVEAIS